MILKKNVVLDSPMELFNEIDVEWIV